MLKKLGTIYLLLLFFFFPSHQILQNNPVNDVVIIYDWLKKTTTTSPAIVLAILECHQALIFGNPSKEIIKSKPLIAPTPQKKFFKNHVFCYIVLTLVSCVCVCIYAHHEFLRGSRTTNRLTIRLSKICIARNHWISKP